MSFAGAGMVLATANALHVYANGSMLLVGGCQHLADTERTMCAAKLLPNGQPDLAFGTNGLVRSSIGGFANSVNVLANGKIVLGGIVSLGADDFAMVVARLMPNGALDTTFGTNGMSSLLVGSTVSNAVMSIDASGRIVISGRCLTDPSTAWQMCAARWMPNGSLDTSFGEFGKVILSSHRLRDSLYVLSAAIIENKLHLGAICVNAAQSGTFCVARFDENGQLDLSFGDSGVFEVVVGTPLAGEIAALIPQGNARLVIAGLCPHATGAAYHPCFARLSADGQLDSTFGTGGKFIDAATQFTHPLAHATAESDGSIVAVGTCQSGPSSGNDICIARYTEDGARDLALPSTLLPFAGYDAAAFVATDHHGMITVAGNCNVETAAFCAYRAHGRAAGNTTCTFDVDGDGTLSAGVDGVLLSRATLGFTGNAVLHGLTFPASATRTKWGTDGTDDIRKFLVSQCGMSLSL